MTDPRLRTTSGNLEAMAAYAGQSAGLIDTLPTAAGRIAEILAQAQMALTQLDRPKGRAL